MLILNHKIILINLIPGMLLLYQIVEIDQWKLFQILIVIKEIIFIKNNFAKDIIENVIQFE